MEFASRAAVAVTGLGLACLYIARFVRAVRDLKNDREQRVLMSVLVVVTFAAVGLIALTERLTGPSPDAVPPSYLVRRAIGLLFFAGFVTFAAWYIDRPERLRKHEFAEGKHCPVCSRPLRPKKLGRPVIHGIKSSTHWLHRCDCGELTLYEEDGQARPVEDRTGGPRAPV